MVSCNESSSHASNSCTMSSAVGYKPVARVEFFGKSNCSLEKLLVDAKYDYSDAEIVVEGVSIGVHRCILALRSQYFYRLFQMGISREGKPKYTLSDLVPYPYVEIGHESFMVILTYLYTGELKSPPPEVATCMDDSCAHDACAPAINYVVELMYLSSAFEMKELVAILQHRLVNCLSKAFVEDLIPILMVAINCQLKQLFSQCAQRIVQAGLYLLSRQNEVIHEFWYDIEFFEDFSYNCLKHDGFKVDILHEKVVRKVYRALDSDDIELVQLLLDEYCFTLDDAYALHYAAAYCNHKVVKKLLELGMADLSRRDPRGFTVLHVAAKGKDPSVIANLLDKGASISDKTRDGRTAVTMCRRMTRLKDYYKKSELGQENSEDRLCVDLLERALFRLSSAGNMLKLSLMTAPAENREEEIVKALGTDIRTDFSFSSPSETDSVLLERARKLLRGNTERRNMQHQRLDKAMLTFDIDKAGNSTSFSTSSCSVSPCCGV